MSIASHSQLAARRIRLTKTICLAAAIFAFAGCGNQNAQQVKENQDNMASQVKYHQSLDAIQQNTALTDEQKKQQIDALNAATIAASGQK